MMLHSPARRQAIGLRIKIVLQLAACDLLELSGANSGSSIWLRSGPTASGQESERGGLRWRLGSEARFFTLWGARQWRHISGNPTHDTE